MLLDGRTVARNEFAEKLEDAQKDLNGGWSGSISMATNKSGGEIDSHHRDRGC